MLQKLAPEISSRLDRSIESIDKALQRVRDESHKPAGASDAMSVATISDCRAMLRAMGDQERDSLIRQTMQAPASRDNDLLILAVLDGHPSLSGIDHEKRSGYRTLFRKTRFPDHVEREGRYVELSKLAHQNAISIREQVKKLATNQDAKRSFEADRLVRAAEAAVKG